MFGFAGKKVDVPDDGLGQSVFVDTLWAWRFWFARRQPMKWRKPLDEDWALLNARADLEPFGDWLDAAAERDGRRWLVVTRDWHGWPDPPEFAVFALEAGGDIWMARDFSVWPRAWVREGDGT